MLQFQVKHQVSVRLFLCHLCYFRHSVLIALIWVWLHPGKLKLQSFPTKCFSPLWKQLDGQRLPDVETFSIFLSHRARGDDSLVWSACYVTLDNRDPDLWPVRGNVDRQRGPGPEVGDQVPPHDVPLGAAQVQPRGREAEGAGEAGPWHLDGGAHNLATCNTGASIECFLWSLALDTLYLCCGFNNPYFLPLPPESQMKRYVSN